MDWYIYDNGLRYERVNMETLASVRDISDKVEISLIRKKK